MAIKELSGEEQNFWRKALMIDRRWLYLALFVQMSIFLFVPWRLLDAIPSEVRNVYQLIETIPTDKLVVVSSNWGPATSGENLPQFGAILEHLMQRKIKFAIVSFASPQTSAIAYTWAQTITQKHNYRYGEDWVHWGLIPGISVGIKGMNNSFVKAVKRDIRNTPLDQIPMMQHFKNMGDVSLVVDVTPSGTVGAWIAFVRKGVKIAYCPTGVMAAEGYTYLASGQLSGMLPGIKGAYDYELLMKNDGGLASKLMNPIQFSHLLMVLTILFGNLCLLIASRQRR